MEWKARLWDEENQVMIHAEELAFETYLPVMEHLNTKGMMFYSGLKDCTLKEIFEEDYIEIDQFQLKGRRFKVIFKNGSFGFDEGIRFRPLYQFNWDRIRVVGNSYEGTVKNALGARNVQCVEPHQTGK